MKKVMIITTLMMAFAVVFTGCQTATPSKAQSAVVKADYINVNGAGNRDLYKMLDNVEGLTPESVIAIIEAATALAQVSEINVVSQTMSNETGGDESNEQTATNAPETPIDIKPATGTDAIAALVGAGAEGITKGLTDKDPATATNTGKTANAVDPNCPDGNCAPVVP